MCICELVLTSFPSPAASTSNDEREKHMHYSEASRYGVRLLKRGDRATFNQMRAVLGYYDLRVADKTQQPKVEEVTVSILQTMRYLPLDKDVKQQLANYKVTSLNRELELLHGTTKQYLTQIKAQEPKPRLQSMILGRSKDR